MCVAAYACVYTDGLQCVLVDVIVLSYVTFSLFFLTLVRIWMSISVHACARHRSGRAYPLFIDCKEVLSVSVRAAE